MAKMNALEKARSQLKKSEHAHTPSTIKKRLKKSRVAKAKTSK